jgi:hypothetical protein
LDAAINLCSAGRGDYILVAQGHAETIIVDGGIDADVAGITIIGAGYGDARPTFTFGTAAAADMNIDADDVTISNCIFKANLATLVAVITVTNDDATISNCSFVDGAASGLGMIAVGAADGDSDRLTITGCDFYQPGTTNDHAIEILKDMVGIKIAGNLIYGDYDEGAIAIPAGGNACLDLNIVGNIISNKLTSVGAIIVNGTSTTGMLADNTIYVDTLSGSIDPGSLKCSENYVVIAGDESAVLYPAVGTAAETKAGQLYVSSMTSTVSTADDLFDVAGGAILITSMVGVVTTQIQAQATSVELALDADAGWTDYDFSTAVELNGDAAGTRYVFSDANESVLTPLEGADAGATILMSGWHCGEGMIELNSTAASTGNIKWYMTWIPMDDGTTVTAQ